MPIRLHLEHTGQGVLLSRIETHSDAESLCAFFSERGVAATVIPLPATPACCVYLEGMTPQELAGLIDGADIELVP